MLETSLVATIVLCGLVAGLLFAFAVVAMPGLQELPDREFLRAFQVMDRVIQDNQPLFMVAWVGSVIGVVVTLVIGLGQLAGIARVALLAAGVAYLAGVQLPTVLINIPLNNQVQQLDLANASEQQLRDGRKAFETRWNSWNRIRSAMASVAVLLMAVLLAQL